MNSDITDICMAFSSMHSHIRLSDDYLDRMICNIIWYLIGYTNQQRAINKSSGGEKRCPKQCSRNSFSISSISSHTPHPKALSGNLFSSWDKLAADSLSILRSCGCIPVWSFKCFAEELLLAKGLLNVFCFSDAWVLLCFFRCLICMKPLSQTSHMYGFSPVWVLTCLFRLLSLENDFRHSWHLYGFSPAWVLTCLFRSPSLENDLPDFRMLFYTQTQVNKGKAFSLLRKS